MRKRHASTPVALALLALLALLAGTIACAASAACNGITGTGKYDIVDCPNGVCEDAGGATGTTDAQGSADGTSSDTGANADTGDTPLPDCGSGKAPIRLTVTGAGGSVSSNPGGLSVSVGTTQTACFTRDTVELRTNGGTATWTGPSCKDGNTGRDRCELTPPAGGIVVTAALQ